MLFKLTNFIIIIFITALINMVTTIISWQRKNSKGGNYFSFGMIAITLWTIAIGLDYAAIPLDLKIFFAKLENTGYNGALALFALFCLSYAGFDDWLKKSWVKSLFWLIPLSSILMAWTNDFHNLLWTDFTVTGLGQNAVIFHHGPGFLWTSITGYIMIVIMLASLALASREGSELSRRQARILFGAVLIPILGNIVYLVNDKDVTGIDWTPVAFSISGIFILVALYSSRLLDIVPIARNSMIEKMPDGVLVLDALNHVVDFNFAAQNVFAIHPQQLGKNIETVIPHWSELIAFAKTPSQDVLQTIIRDQANAAIFDTRKTLLIDDRKQLYGKLIILRNITKQFEIEQQLNERVKELRCIYDLALLSEAPENTLEDILQASVKLISDAMSFPEIACARLIFEGQTFATENYQEPASKITNKIILGGNEVGVLEAGYLDGPESPGDLYFLDEERNLLDIVAKRLVEIIHMQRAQNMLNKQQRELAKLEERKRMARDLHDSVSQSIHSMVLFSETLAATLEKGNYDRALQISDRIQESARQSHKETRLLLYELQFEGPNNQVNLIQDLEERLARVERHTGVKAEIIQEGILGKCSTQLHKDLFWIATEALNNATKHAQARNVQIIIRCLPGLMEMEIIDDGKGFDLEHIHTGGLGLENMQARAAEFGGTLTINTSPGAGTSVRVSITKKAEEYD